MARTSENGDNGESSHPGPGTAAAFEAQWSERGSSDCNVDPIAIKQELLIDLDHSPDVSLSIGGKEWPFVSTDSGTELLSGDEVIQSSVLFGSNITDSANKQKLEKMLEQSTNSASKKVISNLLLEIAKLSDMERLCLYFKLPLGRSMETDPLRMPLNPLGSRPEIMQTVVWIETHLEEDADISLPKHEVYEEYIGYCTENSVKPLSTADFGKVMKQVFPNVRPRRLGTRGHSRYCYSGLRKKEELKTPVLADLYCDTESKSSSRVSDEETNISACALVKEWAEKLLGINVTCMADLANYLVDKSYVDLHSKSVAHWNSQRVHHHIGVDSEGGSGGGSNRLETDLIGQDKDHMRELKRKLQEQHSLASRRQSVQNRHSKKTKVAATATASACVPATASSVDPLVITSRSPTTSPPSVTAKERDSKCSKKNAGRSKRKQLKGNAACEDLGKNGSNALESSCDGEGETSGGCKQPGAKVAIPRLSHNRSPRPSSTSTFLLLPSQSTSSSPTMLPTLGKPKFVPIQPKPCENGNSHSSGSTLPQLKEESGEGTVRTGRAPGDQWEGGLQDEELANYWPSAGGEDSADCPSPKPQAQTQSQTNQLSQLRVLLEQNEELFAKKKPSSGLLERRNVRFEAPLADHIGVVGELLSNGGESVGVAGVATTVGVPPSPNTRRLAFDFTPISPRLTPDVPPSPSSVSGCGGGQLRQLLSTSGAASPFVSPRQTPVPSSLPSSQPHSRHNSGHQISLDTPTSMVTEASSVSTASDSAFVSPLNTPLSVNRSRHNSASNMLVNRARHSSGASITLRHMPYTTQALNHGPDGSLLHGHASRSRHSSAGSPSSLPRSAPLSPLVQNPNQQQQSDCVLGSERLRQDLRKRHVSAGMVLGLSRQTSVGRQRGQPTLNNAIPSWGNDPLAQEIEGLLDSASSGVNSTVDSVLNRSQSVPLSQMIQQELGPGTSQSFSSLSQPTTPFGPGKPFVFSASAASSPYSYTATPVPSEWNDFSSHANSVESGADGFGGFEEIISEVFNKNREELNPYLDGLGAEVLQSVSTPCTTDFNSHSISLQGTSAVFTNMDSDPSLSCSDTGDGFPVSELSDTVQMHNLMGSDDLAAALVTIRDPDLNRLVQDVSDPPISGNRSKGNMLMN